MNSKRFFIGLTVAAAIAACTDRQPAGLSDKGTATTAPSFQVNPKHASGLLTDVPVTGLLPGGTFTGTMTITHFAMNGDQVVASGVLTGASTIAGTVTPITQAFTDIPVALSGHHSRCEIVTLDLGPLHLDLLGLVVDLNEVVLDVAAESGAGNLLGNLLCAVTHLLDGPGLLGSIQNFLDRINALLG